MPDKDTHLKQAAHNEKLAETLSNTGYQDWAVTCFFYAAVHYVEALLAVQRIHSDNHEERNGHVRRQLRTDGVREKYEGLRISSRQSRYDGIYPTADQFNEAKNDYETVKNKIRSMLGIKD